MTQQQPLTQGNETMTTALATKQRFNGRVRFNWGFHDATFDSERSKPRRLTVDGEQNPETVSWTYDVKYAEGYACGLRSYRENGEREQSSDRAYDAYQSGEEVNAFA